MILLVLENLDAGSASRFSFSTITMSFSCFSIRKRLNLHRNFFFLQIRLHNLHRIFLSSLFRCLFPVFLFGKDIIYIEVSSFIKSADTPTSIFPFSTIPMLICFSGSSYSDFYSFNPDSYFLRADFPPILSLYCPSPINRPIAAYFVYADIFPSLQVLREYDAPPYSGLRLLLRGAPAPD